MGKLLVTGATGQLGKQVMSHLLKKAGDKKLAVLVRDVSKAEDLKIKGVEVLEGDYDNYGSLLDAFHDVDKLYFISSADNINREKQHENVINAAKETAVKHVIYTSFQHENETDSSPVKMVGDIHTKTNQWLIDSGLTYTILKHILYAEFAPAFWGDKVLETGAIYFPAGNGKVAFLLRSDMAEIGANVLTSTGHENKVYSIAGEENYSFSDIAEIISSASGNKIKFISPTTDEYIKTLSGMGVPEMYVKIFAGFGEAIKQGEFQQISTDATRILGRKPTSFAQFLRDLYS